MKLRTHVKSTSFSNNHWNQMNDFEGATYEKGSMQLHCKIPFALETSW